MSTSPRPSEAELAEAVARIAAGEAIGLPTETVYGLAADAANRDGVAAIYRIKGRPADHPLIVHVLDAERARQWADWPAEAQRLADAFWPGPLTLVLRRRADAPAWACGGQPTIGLRAPAHPLARALLQRLAPLGITGLAAPSANRFGRVSPTSAAHVRADLGDDIALVLDGGSAPVGIESTIVDLSRGTPVLLRPGAIGADRLAAVLGAAVAAPDRAAPRVSGSLPSHYAPVTPLDLVPTARLAERVAAARAAGERVAVWSAAPVAGSDDGVLWRERPADVDATARMLYASLRELDRLGVARILVEAPADAPQWAAVADRLRRAATR
ncbi:MAG: L-threonylcarbamoyladenylate synthase [Lautropia sp.]